MNANRETRVAANELKGSLSRDISEHAGIEGFQHVSCVLTDINVVVGQGCNHIRNGLGGICAESLKGAYCYASDIGDLAGHRAAYWGDCGWSNEREHIEGRNCRWWVVVGYH